MISDDLVYIFEVIIYCIIIYYLFTKKVKLFCGKSKESGTQFLFYFLALTISKFLAYTIIA